MEECTTPKSLPQQIVRVFDLPMVTIEIFRNWANLALHTCFAYQNWSLIDGPPTDYGDKAQRSAFLENMVKRTGRPAALLAEEADASSTSNFTQEVFAPAGHVAVGITARLKKIDTVRVSLAYWSDEPFGNCLMKMVDDEWPEVINVYPKTAPTRAEPPEQNIGGWQPPRGLSPNERIWLLICLQAEIERHHGMSYTLFCQQAGINQKTYDTNKSKLTKAGHDLRAWIPDKKPAEMRAEVVAAIRQKQETAWMDSGETQGKLRGNTGSGAPADSLQWLHD